MEETPPGHRSSMVRDEDENGVRGRDETPEERLDRKFGDLLQELRVMQTGAQLTAAFLLTIPFQERFHELDDFQIALYLVLVLLATTTTALVLGPVAVHRRLAGRHVKDRVLTSSHVLATGALTCLATLIVGILVLVFDVVVDRSAALVTGGLFALLLVAVMVVVPRTLTERGSARRTREVR